MPTPLLQQRLSRVSANARRRLDGVDKLLPAQREPLPIEEYLARAATHAQADPEFRRQLQAAMTQYQAAGRVLNGRD